MNPFNHHPPPGHPPSPSSYPAILAYGLWIIWPFLSLAWMILWW